MNRVHWGLIALAAGIPALLSVSPASALQLSQNAIQVFPAEGNGVCRDYASNSVILEADGNPESMPSGTVTGPENPQDPDMTGESADYTYDPVTKVLNFNNSTTPIDYVLVKSSREINVYLYPSGGVVEDFGLVLIDPATGEKLPIARFALCYGLEDLVQEPSESLPDCTLDVFPNVGVACDAAADGTVISFWDPHTDPRNPDFRRCVCNNGGQGVSVQCDPATNGNPDVQDCFNKDRPIALPEAPITIELFGDPIYCSTIGGTRSCQCIDNPFTLENECAF